MDRASATEAVDTGSIPGRVKPKTIKLVFTAFLLDVQQSKGLCEASAVCGRQVGRWQLDLKTERSLRCLLAKATWRIKCNYNYNYIKMVFFSEKSKELPSGWGLRPQTSILVI